MKRDRAYLTWIRSLPCAVLTHIPGATRCFGAIEAHHPTGAGMALKSGDRAAFPMCHRHHVEEFHALKGTFFGWVKDRLKQWQRDMSAHYQALAEQRKAG